MQPADARELPFDAKAIIEAYERGTQ